MREKREGVQQAEINLGKKNRCQVEKEKKEKKGSYRTRSKAHTHTHAHIHTYATRLNKLTDGATSRVD